MCSHSSGLEMINNWRGCFSKVLGAEERISILNDCTSNNLLREFRSMTGRHSAPPLPTIAYNYARTHFHVNRVFFKGRREFTKSWKMAHFPGMKILEKDRTFACICLFSTGFSFGQSIELPLHIMNKANLRYLIAATSLVISNEIQIYFQLVSPWNLTDDPEKL